MSDIDLSFLQPLDIAFSSQTRLAEVTTFRLGGPCLALVECSHADEVVATVRALREHKVPFLLMGFGSNILASDQGVDRVVVRYAALAEGTVGIKAFTSPTVEVDAGMLLDDLVLWAVKQGLEGLTVFSGIPGTVGGAIAGNAGAYGRQISDVIESLTLLKPDNSIATVPRSAIRFDYRDSDLKHNSDIVLSAGFRLQPGGNAAVMTAKRSETLHVRETKHGRWQETPCAGSFFKNVAPSSKAGPRQSAGWFLEQAGTKALNVHGAHAYEKHANIVTRDPCASAQDVYDLILQMRDSVKSKFGIDLIREVRLLGEFKNAPDCNPHGYW